MAGRPPKEGVDYFPLEVGFFSDDKVEMLEGEHGPIGSYVFMRLLCLIYKDNGYFYEWDDSARVLMAKRTGGMISPQKVELIVRSCVKWSLFDRTLFDTYAILTSSGIQRRYLNAIKARAKKAAAEGRHIEVDERFWLVDETATSMSFVKVGQIPKKSENNAKSSREELHNSPPELPKEKNSRIKENKEEKKDDSSAARAESKPVRHKYGSYKNVLLSDEEMEKLQAEFPTDWEERIERLSEYIASKGAKYKDFLATIRNWARKENPSSGKRGKDAAERYEKIGLYV